MFVLITGGAASGKSEIAENLTVAMSCGQTAYVATMLAHDGEGQRRVEKHRHMRAGKGFETLEIPYGLHEHLPALAGYDTVLMECMSNLLLNEIFVRNLNYEEASASIAKAVAEAASAVPHLVVVSGVIFPDLKEYDAFTLEYIKGLGLLNRGLAARADAVLEAVCGIPVIYKGRKELAAYENVV